MISLRDIMQAEEKIKSFVKKTPLVNSRFLSEVCNGEVYLKLENQQVSNSFKIRGTTNKMLHLSVEERKRGIVTASSGNHAIAVAIAAQRFNTPVKVVVPKNTPKKKIEKIKKYNVNLIMYGDIYDQAEEKALELAEKEELTYISPYNDKQVIAGQGTIGLEIIEELSNIDVITVPVGGGGLISGISTAVKSLRPNVKVFGVQPETSAVMYESIKAGRILSLSEVKTSDSIADGVLGGVIKEAITFKVIQKHVDEFLLVDEETIRRAVYLLWKKEKQRVEGAGALSVAAILAHKNRFSGKRTISVISGGNIDDEPLQSIIEKYEGLRV